MAAMEIPTVWAEAHSVHLLALSLGENQYAKIRAIGGNPIDWKAWFKVQNSTKRKKEVKYPKNRLMTEDAINIEPFYMHSFPSEMYPACLCRRTLCVRS